jgi:uncharacterized small protein (DUF1192 family)
VNQAELDELNHAIIEAYEALTEFFLGYVHYQNQRIGELQAEIEKLRGARPKEYEGC